MGVKIKIEVTQGQGWSQVGEITQGEVMGSMTDCTHGRDVLLFGFQNGMPGVWKSPFGFDYQLGELRGVTAIGLEELSDLIEPYERPIIFEGGGLCRVRWSVVGSE